MRLRGKYRISCAALLGNNAHKFTAPIKYAWQFCLNTYGKVTIKIYGAVMCVLICVPIIPNVVLSV